MLKIHLNIWNHWQWTLKVSSTRTISAHWRHYYWSTAKYCCEQCSKALNWHQCRRQSTVKRLTHFMSASRWWHWNISDLWMNSCYITLTKRDVKIFISVVINMAAWSSFRKAVWGWSPQNCIARSQLNDFNAALGKNTIFKYVVQYLVRYFKWNKHLWIINRFPMNFEGVKCGK